MPRTDILGFIATRVVIVVAILAVAEGAFRLGAWEPFANRESNAGQTIALRRALESIGPEKLDFITIGDSRAVYGLDHERIAAVAKSRGYTHASVAIPGMHWMSMRALVDWLRERAPNIKGAVIATTPSNFMFLGNGAYELNMVAPLSRAWDSAWMTKHVPFDPGNLSTYGTQSALFLYREDVHDWVRHPLERLKSLRAGAADKGSTGTLFSRQKVTADLCSQPIDTVKACASAQASGTNAAVIAQCRQWNGRTDPRGDFSDTTRAPHLAEVRDVRAAQLREMPYAKPIVVVMMPMPRIWLDEVIPAGLEGWTRSVLIELQREGVVEVHDYTRYFQGENGPECRMYWDLYHQNTLGQDRLTDALLPILEKRLYSRSPAARNP